MSKSEKEKNYDILELKSYMKKQKEVRRLKELKEEEVRAKELERKKKELKKLNEKCRNLVVNNVAKKKVLISQQSQQEQQQQQQISSKKSQISKKTSPSNFNVIESKRSTLAIATTSEVLKQKNKLVKSSSKLVSKVETSPLPPPPCLTDEVNKQAAKLFTEFEYIVQRECMNVLNTVSTKILPLNNKPALSDKGVETSFSLTQNNNNNKKDISSHLSSSEERIHKKRKARSRKIDKELEIRNLAAAKIQAAFRGYRIRKIMKETNLLNQRKLSIKRRMSYQRLLNERNSNTPERTSSASDLSVKRKKVPARHSENYLIPEYIPPPSNSPFVRSPGGTPKATNSLKINRKSFAEPFPKAAIELLKEKKSTSEIRLSLSPRKSLQIHEQKMLISASKERKSSISNSNKIPVVEVEEDSSVPQPSFFAVMKEKVRLYNEELDELKKIQQQKSKVPKDANDNNNRKNIAKLLNNNNNNNNHLKNNNNYKYKYYESDFESEISSITNQRKEESITRISDSDLTITDDFIGFGAEDLLFKKPMKSSSNNNKYDTKSPLKKKQKEKDTNKDIVIKSPSRSSSKILQITHTKYNQNHQSSDKNFQFPSLENSINNTIFNGSSKSTSPSSTSFSHISQRVEKQLKQAKKLLSESEPTKLNGNFKPNDNDISTSVDSKITTFNDEKYDNYSSFLEETQETENDLTEIKSLDTTEIKSVKDESTRNHIIEDSEIDMNENLDIKNSFEDLNEITEVSELSFNEYISEENASKDTFIEEKDDNVSAVEDKVSEVLEIKSVVDSEINFLKDETAIKKTVVVEEESKNENEEYLDTKDNLEEIKQYEEPSDAKLPSEENSFTSMDSRNSMIEENLENFSSFLEESEQSEDDVTQVKSLDIEDKSERVIKVQEQTVEDQEEQFESEEKEDVKNIFEDFDEIPEVLEDLSINEEIKSQSFNSTTTNLPTPDEKDEILSIEEEKESLKQFNNIESENESFDVETEELPRKDFVDDLNEQIEIESDEKDNTDFNQIFEVTELPEIQSEENNLTILEEEEGTLITEKDEPFSIKEDLDEKEISQIKSSDSFNKEELEETTIISQVEDDVIEKISSEKEKNLLPEEEEESKTEIPKVPELPSIDKKTDDDIICPSSSPLNINSKDKLVNNLLQRILNEFVQNQNEALKTVPVKKKEKTTKDKIAEIMNGVSHLNNSEQKSPSPTASQSKELFTLYKTSYMDEFNDKDEDENSPIIEEPEDEWFEDEMQNADQDDESLKREAEKIQQKRMRIENEIRALEALNKNETENNSPSKINISEIPDKPPPPYSPPSSESISLSLSYHSFLISCEESKVKDLVTKFVSLIWDQWSETKMLTDEDLNAAFVKLTSESNGNTLESEEGQESPTLVAPHAFESLLNDVVKDTIKELLMISEPKTLQEYIESVRLGPMALQAKKLKICKTKEELIAQTVTKVLDQVPQPILSDYNNTINLIPAEWRKKRLTKWTSRPRDQVDEILAEELIEEDREWTEIWPEELLVIDRVSENIIRMAIRVVIKNYEIAYQ